MWAALLIARMSKERTRRACALPKGISLASHTLNFREFVEEQHVQKSNRNRGAFGVPAKHNHRTTSAESGRANCLRRRGCGPRSLRTALGRTRSMYRNDRSHGCGTKKMAAGRGTSAVGAFQNLRGGLRCEWV